MSDARHYRCVLVLCAILVLVGNGCAQSTGTLMVSMTVQSSIDLVFETAPGGCTLSNSGTNNVGLDLGWGIFTGGGQYTGCGTMKKTSGAWYQVSTPFNLVVTKSNSSSANYTVSAWLSALPPANVQYVLNPNGSGVGLTLSTSSQVVHAAQPYGTSTETYAVQVRNQAAAGVLNATVYFLAAAN